MAIVSGLAALVDSSNSTASADDYFAGKQLRIVVPSDTAGAYSLYGQLAASHLTRFIPGNPGIVISYMPGAGGLRAMNYLQEAAPRDGTTIAILIQDLASRQALATEGVRFDATKFHYIGRATANVPVHMVWHTALAQSIADIKKKEVVTGATGTSGTHVDLPRAQNALMATKWKIIPGYKGINEARIAMERGEVQAVISPATLFNDQLRPWLDQGKVKVLVQYADFRHPIFPDVPAIVDLAESPEAKRVFKFLVSLATVGRAFAVPPGVPTGTVGILRQAFQAMINDPAFKADAEKRGADLLPMAGEELATYIKDVVATPPEIIKMTAEATAAK